MNQSNKEKHPIPLPGCTPPGPLENCNRNTGIWLGQVGEGFPAMPWGLNSGPYLRQSHSATS